MPRAGSEPPFTLNKENLVSFRISVLQRPVLTIEMVVKKKYCLTGLSSYQLMVLSRRVRYASTTAGVGVEFALATSPKFH